MSGRVVVVSGGGSGLGLHITDALLAAGDRVVAGYATSRAALDARVREHGADRLVAVPGDLRDEATSEALARAAGALGGVDAVVHNASVTRDQPLVTTPLGDWQAVHEVNLQGAFLLTKHLVRQMMRRKAGRFVFVSSLVALQGNAGQAAYAASKAGLVGLSHSIGQEYARFGVTSCVLAAGLIDVGMARRLPERVQREKLDRVLHGAVAPEHMAGIATFLSTPAAAAINATVVRADTGVRF